MEMVVFGNPNSVPYRDSVPFLAQCPLLEVRLYY